MRREDWSWNRTKFQHNLKNCDPGWRRCGGIFDVENKDAELKIIEQKTAEPDFWDDPNAARKVIDQANALRDTVKPYQELAEGVEELGIHLDLATEEEDPKQVQTALGEAESLLGNLNQKAEKLEYKALLSEPFDANNAYLTLHAGAGGTESCDWADMLLRMYTRYAESHNFELSVLDHLPGEEAGIKSATLLISGPYAYGYLKNERGVHRLVRISPFDANSRRHTSFAALDVVAEVDDDIDVEINDSDLRVDTYRSSGAGGQHVNTTDSAVRITHEPTGLVVQCQAERSQHANRNKAMQMLKAKIYDYQLDQQRKEMEKFYGDKGEIAWGSQIRSYVMQPYTMVKDHRTHTEMGNAQRVLDGDLDLFIEAQLKSRQSE